MMEGIKKDAEYIMNHFQKTAVEWNGLHMYMNCIFDRAANEQKAGAILCATYPQAICFHGGEHFLSDLLKLRPIKVVIFNLIFSFLSLSNNISAPCSCTS